MQLPEMTRFDAETLETPDAFHWPGYFWLWNDVLQREKLFRQLRDMDSRGGEERLDPSGPGGLQAEVHEDESAARVSVGGVPGHPR